MLQVVMEIVGESRHVDCSLTMTMEGVTTLSENPSTLLFHGAMNSAVNLRQTNVSSLGFTPTHPTYFDQPISDVCLIIIVEVA